MRNLILFGLLVILLVAVQFASGQTVDEVIEKYEKARGGKDKLAGIKSIYMEGSREMMGGEVTVKITREQGKLSRAEFEMGASNGFVLVTQQAAWNYFPGRMETPQKLPAEAVADLQTDLDIAGPLVEYAAKGHKAELLGKDTVDGITCFRIKLTTISGKEIKYWIDTSTFLLVQSATKGGGLFSGGRKKVTDVETITLFKDYREEEGILFPHVIEIKNPNAEGRSSGGTTFDKFEINKPVDAKLYKPE